MASVRALKKDIDYLLSLVVEDCIYVMKTHAEVDKEKVMDIARSIIVKHRELRLRTNHPDGKDNPKLVKAYYKAVVTELYASANQSLEQLTALMSK